MPFCAYHGKNAGHSFGPLGHFCPVPTELTEPAGSVGRNQAVDIQHRSRLSECKRLNAKRGTKDTERCAHILPIRCR